MRRILYLIILCVMGSAGGVRAKSDTSFVLMPAADRAPSRNDIKEDLALRMQKAAVQQAHLQSKIGRMLMQSAAFQVAVAEGVSDLVTGEGLLDGAPTARLSRACSAMDEHIHHLEQMVERADRLLDEMTATLRLKDS